MTALTVTFGAVPIAAQTADHVNPADRTSIERIERSLADDSMEGRATATPGGERAARFLAGEMRRIGLQPGGDDGYFQTVPMKTPAARAATGPRRGRTGRGSRGGRMTVVDAPADLDTVPEPRRRVAHNVIGILPGADPVLRNEVILVLSHYDHLGVGRPDASGDSIFNGADDDASGTTAVLEIARHLSRGAPPKRTVVFANMTGEEIGLLGTNYFINHPVVPLTQIVAGFEIEMIGRPDSLAGGSGKAWLTGYERSTMGDMLKSYGIPIVPDVRPCQRYFTRSDNYELARHGIVAQTLSTFNGHSDYHRASDEVGKIDFDHMTGVIAAATEAVRDLANNAKPAWHPGMDPVTLPPTVPASCSGAG
jgi:hypothetical protein